MPTLSPNLGYPAGDLQLLPGWETRPPSFPGPRTEVCRYPCRLPLQTLGRNHPPPPLPRNAYPSPQARTPSGTLLPEMKTLYGASSPAPPPPAPTQFRDPARGPLLYRLTPLPDSEPQTPAPRLAPGVRDPQPARRSRPPPLGPGSAPGRGPLRAGKDPDFQRPGVAALGPGPRPWRPGASHSPPGEAAPVPDPRPGPRRPGPAPRPQRCGTSADDGQAGQGGGGEKPEPGPGRRGGHRGSGGVKGEGKGGAGPGRARPGGEGKGEGDPACGCTGPGGGGGGGRGLGGRDEAAGAAADPGRGAALTGRKADQSGEAGGRGGGAEGGLLVGRRGLCYCGPAPTPSILGRPYVFPSRIPRTLGLGHFSRSALPSCFRSQSPPLTQVPGPSPSAPRPRSPGPQPLPQTRSPGPPAPSLRPRSPGPLLPLFRTQESRATDSPSDQESTPPVPCSSRPSTPRLRTPGP